MNNKPELYLQKLSSELNKEAGRGDMVFKLLGRAVSTHKMTPKSMFSRATGKMIDLRGTLDKITGTANTLKNVIKTDGIMPKDNIFTRSLQSDYARLLRSRLNELDGITSQHALN